MTDFQVRPTGNRSDSHGDYLIRMSPEACRSEFGKWWWVRPRMVVVSYRHPLLQNVELSAVAWLRAPLEGKNISGESVVELDQTLRRALGLPPNNNNVLRVTVSKLHKARIVRQLLAKLVGRRLVYCRPSALHTLDIEKRIVRIPPEVSALLGIAAGDGVILCGIEKASDGTYWMRRHRVSALEASKEYMEKLEKMAGKEMSNRFADVGTLIYERPYNEMIASDLRSVFLDKDTRDVLFGPLEGQNVRCDPNNDQSVLTPEFLLNAQSAQPALMYRAPLGALAKEIMTITFTAAALTFFINGALPERLMLTPFLSFSSGAGKFMWALTISATIALWFAIIKTRNSAR